MLSLLNTYLKDEQDSIDAYLRNQEDPVSGRLFTVRGFWPRSIHSLPRRVQVPGENPPYRIDDGQYTTQPRRGLKASSTLSSSLPAAPSQSGDDPPTTPRQYLPRVSPPATGLPPANYTSPFNLTARPEQAQLECELRAEHPSVLPLFSHFLGPLQMLICNSNWSRRVPRSCFGPTSICSTTSAPQ